MTPKILVALMTSVLASSPALALACPYCAGRSGNPVAQGIVLGAFVFFPFLVAYVVIRVVKRGEALNKRDEGHSETTRQ